MDNRRKRRPRFFTRQMQARLLLVFCVILMVFIIIIGRLIYIHKSDGERYEKRVLSRQAYVSAVTPYRRGEILDRNGTVIARSELKYRLIMDPNMLLLQKEKGKDYIEDTKNALANYFNYATDSFMDILSEKSDSQYVILLKELDYNLVQKFKAYMSENKDKIKGVWFEEEYIRNYPYDNIAPDLIGFVNTENLGLWGIESYYNNELNGINGRSYGYYDSSLNIGRIVKSSRDGNSVISTIDVNIQRIIQKHIKLFNEEYGSKNIAIAVMNPNNGEIIAMASNEEYDLNNPRDLKPFYLEDELSDMDDDMKMELLNKIWGNYVISDGYEPGSTFKPFTIAAALEENLIDENTTFYCDGFERVGGYDIGCSKRTGHGMLTLEEVLMYSCNDALMQIAALETREIFYDYQNRFLFGSKTGIDLPGEGTGILVSKEKLNASELATSSFGQSFTVTMTQMLAAYSSVVNGGTYYTPHIAKEIINQNGATVRVIDKTPVKKTVSEKTSQLLNKYLYSTVEAGTAKGAKVAGYMVGGKTGTAEKFPRSDKNYIVSFIGSVPAFNPEMVIYVLIDEPQNVVKQDDSSLATVLASKVMTEILPALGIYPNDDNIDYLLPEDYKIDDEDGNQVIPE